MDLRLQSSMLGRLHTHRSLPTTPTYPHTTAPTTPTHHRSLPTAYRRQRRTAIRLIDALTMGMLCVVTVVAVAHLTAELGCPGEWVGGGGWFEERVKHVQGD